MKISYKHTAICSFSAFLLILAFQNFSKANDCRPITSQNLDLGEKIERTINQSQKNNCAIVLGQVTYKALKKLSPEGYVQAEMHASLEPPIQSSPSNIRAAINPIESLLVSFLDNTPKNSVIHVAVYGFRNEIIQTAFDRAIRRGVSVQIITTENGNEIGGHLQNIIKRYSNNDPRAADSFVHFCENKLDRKGQYDRNLDGGCLSNNLMHHKYVLFSKICRFGLNKNDNCQNGPEKDPNFYSRVVYQGSWNFLDALKFNIASAFFGNETLYTSYRKNFANMLRHSMSQNPVKSLSQVPDAIVMSKNSVLKVQFTPVARRFNAKNEIVMSTDIFLRDFKSTQCTFKSKGKVSRAIIRISHAGWGSGADSAYATWITKNFQQLVQQGCIVKVLLSSEVSLPKHTSHSYSSNEQLAVNLMKAGIQIRSFAHAKSGFSMHTKYAVVTPADSSKPDFLMFGSLNLTDSGQVNDNVWLSWRNPSREAFLFYRNAFDRIWDELPNK